MKVIGKRSIDLLFGMLIGLIIVGASVTSMVLVKSITTYMIAPAVIGLMIMAFYGYQYFGVPYNIILFNEETNELQINSTNRNSVTIKLENMVGMYQMPSGIRRNKTANIAIEYRENTEDYSLKNDINKCVVAKYINNADAITKMISEKKEQLDSEKFSVYEKL